MYGLPGRAAALAALFVAAGTVSALGQGTTDAPGILAPDAPVVPAEAVELSASDLMGKPVIDAAGDSLGQIADVIITTTGEVKRLVISRGGVWGIGDEVVAIDFTAVRILPAEGKVLVSGLTRDEIERHAEGR